MRFNKRTYKVALEVNDHQFWETVGECAKVIGTNETWPFERITRLQEEEALIRARAEREGIRL